MVGVINPARGDSIDTQRQAAINAPFQLSPGQPWPAEGAGSMTTSSANPSVIRSSHISGGAIAGIALGVTIAVILIVAIFFFLWRSKILKNETDENEMNYSDTVSRPSRAVVDVAELWSPVQEPSELPGTDGDVLSPITPSPDVSTVGERFSNIPLWEGKRPLSPPMVHPAYRPKHNIRAPEVA